MVAGANEISDRLFPLDVLTEFFERLFCVFVELRLGSVDDIAGDKHEVRPYFILKAGHQRAPGSPLVIRASEVEIANLCDPNEFHRCLPIYKVETVERCRTPLL